MTFLIATKVSFFSIEITRSTSTKGKRCGKTSKTLRISNSVSSGKTIAFDAFVVFFPMLVRSRILLTSSAFRECPGRTAMMWALSGLAKREKSPTISRILWRTNSSSKRRGSLDRILSPLITIALSKLPPRIFPIFKS